jgi:cyclase
MAGVTSRELYSLGDVYVHLLETEADGPSAVSGIQESPEFRRVSAELAQFVKPYLTTWRSPADAMANRFYAWSPTAR